MPARSGKLPARGEWAFEVKWDGFRAIVSIENGAHAGIAGRLGSLETEFREGRGRREAGA